MNTSLLASSTLAALAMAAVAAAPAHSKKAKPKKAEAGVITGSVMFRGKADPKAIDTSSDGFCAKHKLISEDLVVDKGNLRDVHVRIKSGTAGTHKAPSAPVLVEQDGCAYKPHVVGAMQGQSIAIANQDKTMHNVHAYVEGETWFNRSQPKGAPKIVEKDIGKAGEVFELKCDVHKWMHSFVPVTDHPYFAVSGADGSFRFDISGLKAGEYTLEAWHPTLGLKSKKITVGKGAVPAVSFAFP